MKYALLKLPQTSSAKHYLHQKLNSDLLFSSLFKRVGDGHLVASPGDLMVLFNPKIDENFRWSPVLFKTMIHGIVYTISSDSLSVEFQMDPGNNLEKFIKRLVQKFGIDQ